MHAIVFLKAAQSCLENPNIEQALQDLCAAKQRLNHQCEHRWLTTALVESMIASEYAAFAVLDDILSRLGDERVVPNIRFNWRQALADFGWNVEDRPYHLLEFGLADKLRAIVSRNTQI